MPKIRTTSPSVFAERLVDLRKKRHLTQEQLAEEIGLSRATIAYYEASAKNPKLDTIYKVAEFFGVRPEYLIAIQDDEPGRPGPIPRLEQQIVRLRRLSPAKQRLATELLETFLQHA
jgi:transcriptional regulator with XRE-family HTH domain